MANGDLYLLNIPLLLVRKRVARSRRMGRWAALALFAQLLVAMPCYSVDFSGWACSMQITFTNYNKAESLANFPVLVVFNTNLANFAYNRFKSDTGGDLRFTDGTQTNEINYEIESWNSNGDSFVWVQVPIFTNNASVWAYWDNASQTNPPAYTTNGATWSAGYAGVWHMTESNATDSTANTNQGTASKNTDALGKIDGAQDFNGTTNCGVYVPGNQSLYIRTNLTMEAWVYFKGEGINNSFIFTRYLGDVPYYGIARMAGGHGFIAGLDAGGWGSYGANYTLNDGQWYHLAVTYNKTNVELYVDGTWMTNVAETADISGTTNGWFSIGAKPTEFTYATIDEVRLSNVARSSNWVWACWQNQVSNSTFNSYGGVLEGYPWINTSTGAIGLTFTSAWLRASLTSTGGSPTEVWSHWDTNDGVYAAGAWAYSNYFGTNTDATPVAFSNQATGLTSNMLYYYTYRGANASGTNWSGPAETFMTAATTIEATDPTASEEGPDTGTFTVYRPVTITNGALTVYYTLSGTATNGVDYQTLNGQVTMQVGESNATVTVTPIADADNTEGAETVIVTLAPGGYLIGSGNSATVTISDVASGQWNYKMKITFSGYDKGEVLANFPALVIFNTNLNNFAYSQFRSDTGVDLWFSDAAESVVLYYEIEQWSTNTNSYVWVQVPVLTNNASIWAYWGNANRTNPPAYTTDGSTWSNGYAAVWHMTESNAQDSTANNNHGTGYDNTNAMGKIAVAQGFDGTGNCFVKVPGSQSLYIRSNLTMEAWVYFNGDLSGNDFILSKWQSSTYYWGIARYRNGHAYLAGMALPGWGDYASSYVVGDDQWYHVATTYNKTNVRHYVNGDQKYTYAITNDISGSSLGWLGIGGNLSEFAYATIDEVRLSNVARSSNWVWACWQNQVSNSAFNSYGGVLAGYAWINTLAGVTGVTYTSAWLRATLISTGGSPTEVWSHWDTNDGGIVAGAWAYSNYFGTNTDAAPVAFSGQATGLTSNMLYYYTYRAANASGTNWAGQPEIFMTAEASIVATDPDAAEQGPDTGTFTVYRPVTLTNEPVTINYTLSGTAANGVDYQTLSGQVIIPVSESNATVTVTPMADADNTEGEETVIVTLAPGGYLIGSANSVTVTIADAGFDQWNRYKMKITFSGYDRGEVLSNFPALVVFNTNLTNFAYSQFQSDTGGDLRFMDWTGSSLLNYEIEQWSTNTNSYVWVQVPVLTNNACIWAYWGNGNQTNPPAYTTDGSTWSNGYAAVWHMTESNALDSTANTNHGTAYTNANAPGKIGVAQDFNGYLGCRIAVPGSESLYLGTNLTLEAWVYFKGDRTGNDFIFTYFHAPGGGLYYGIARFAAGHAYLAGLAAPNWGDYSSGYAVGDSNWYHLVTTYNKVNVYNYVNGDRKSTQAQTANISGTSTNMFVIGGHYGEFSWATIDEVRLSNVARSSNWVWACWQNHGSNSTFNTYGAVLERDRSGMIFMIR